MTVVVDILFVWGGVGVLVFTSKRGERLNWWMRMNGLWDAPHFECPHTEENTAWSQGLVRKLERVNRNSASWFWFDLPIWDKRVPVTSLVPWIIFLGPSLWRLDIKQAAKRCCLAWLKVDHRPDLRSMFIIEIGWKGCTMARFGAECLKETPQRIALFSDLTFGAPFHNDCKEYRPSRCHPHFFKDYDSREGQNHSKSRRYL